MSTCRSCRAPIRWAKTEHGRVMPIDPEPYEGDDPRGLFVLRHEGGYLLALAVPAGAFPEEPRYRSHFATCPNASEHRR